MQQPTFGDDSGPKFDSEETDSDRWIVLAACGDESSIDDSSAIEITAGKYKNTLDCKDVE